MTYGEAIGYMKELIGSLEQEKLYVTRLGEAIGATERGRMLSALSMKIYALHVGISGIEKEMKRQKDGTTPTAV